MSKPTSRLDPELATALQALERAFRPLQDLDLHPTPPKRRPAPRAVAGGGQAAQPSLFDPTPKPQPNPCPSNPEVMP